MTAATQRRTPTRRPRRVRARYAHPLDVPGGLPVWYVPGGAGSVTSAGPSSDYVPGGLSIGGTYFQGGEALTEPDLVELAAADPGLLFDLLPYLHRDRDRALSDFLSKTTAPRKDELPRQVGTARPLSPRVEAPPSRSPRTRPPRTPEEGRANLPPEIGPYVSDDEALQISPAQAEQAVALLNRSAPVEDYVAGAKLGEAKRGWYADAAEAIVDLFGADAPRFAALLAATSPVKGVGDNLNNALFIWKAYNDLRAELGHEPTRNEVTGWVRTGKMEKALGGHAYAMQSEWPNIIRALTKSSPVATGTLSGPKVDSFRANLQGQLEKATADTWLAAFAGVAHADIDGRNLPDEYGPRQVFSGGYTALAARMRQARDVLNASLEPGQRPWTTAEVQETTWSVFRALAALSGKSRFEQRRAGRAGAPLEQRADRVPDAVRALYSLTHEDVRGNVDFVSLLLQARDSGGPLGRALEALGFGPALDRLAALHARKAQERGALTGRAIGGLGGGDIEPALRVARRAIQASPRFDNAVAKESRKGRPRRGELMISRPLPFKRGGWRPRCDRARYAAPESLIAASSNTETDLSFDEALKRVRSADQKAFEGIITDMLAETGLKGQPIGAVGDWEDGAEHSVLTTLPPDTDLPTLRYLAAWQGLTGNQRAVLVFRPDKGGPDSTYRLEVPETDLLQVRAQLSAAGIPFRTIVPSRTGTQIVIFDEGRRWRDRVAQFASAYNAPVRESIGTGAYIGGGSRAAARKAYRDEIAAYEAGRRAVRSRRPRTGDHRGGAPAPQAASS